MFILGCKAISVVSMNDVNEDHLRTCCFLKSVLLVIHMFHIRSKGLSVWSLHVVPLFAWLFFRDSIFFPFVVNCSLYSCECERELLHVSKKFFSSSCRSSGCVITAASSKKSSPNQGTGSPGRLGNREASGRRSVNRLCAKRLETRSYGLALKHLQTPVLLSKTQTDRASLGPQVAQIHGHVANRHDTRKTEQSAIS